MKSHRCHISENRIFCRMNGKKHHYLLPSNFPSGKEIELYDHTSCGDRFIVHDSSLKKDGILDYFGILNTRGKFPSGKFEISSVCAEHKMNITSFSDDKKMEYSVPSIHCFSYKTCNKGLLGYTKNQGDFYVSSSILKKISMKE